MARNLGNRQLRPWRGAIGTPSPQRTFSRRPPLSSSFRLTPAQGTAASSLIPSLSTMVTNPVAAVPLITTLVLRGQQLGTTWKRWMQPNVIRDERGNIVAPAHQAVLSAINLRKQPFTPLSALKLFAFGAFLGFTIRTGMFASPHHPLSLLDSIWDMAAQGTLSNDFLSGFFEHGYKPGQVYYQKAIADRDYAQLFSLPQYGFQGLSRQPLTNIFQVFATITGALFLFREYTQFIAGSRKRTLNPRSSLVRFQHAIANRNERLGKIADKLLLPQDERISIPRGLAYLGTMMSAWGLFRLSSDTAALHQFTPDGLPSIVGNWPGGNLRINSALYSAYWVAEVASAPLYARFGAVSFLLADHFYTRTADALHDLHHRDIPVFGLDRAFPQVKPREGFDPDGKPVTIPGMNHARAVLTSFTPEEKAAIADPPPFFPRSLSKTSNPAEIAKSGLAYAASLAANGMMMKGAIDFMLEGRRADIAVDVPLMLGGITLSSALIAAHRSKEFWNTFLGILGVGTLKAGAESLHSLTQLRSIEALTIKDPALVLASFGLASFSALSIARDGFTRKLATQLREVLVKMFGPQRIAYWLTLSLINGTSSAGLAIALEAMQGLKPTDNYYTSIAATGYFGPAWINRVGLAIASANGIVSPSWFGFFSPGWFPYYGPYRAQRQIPQGVGQFWRSLAPGIAFSDDAEAKQLIGHMQADYDLIAEAVTQKGYGREETYQAGIDEMRALEKLAQEFRIPLRILSTKN